MALEYLSDDAIYGRARRRKRRASRKAKRAQRKQQRRTRRASGGTRKEKRQMRREQRATRKSAHRTRTGRRQTGKARRKAEGRPSRIARIGLAPARGAFHSAARLNVGKMATKMVRIYNKPGGKEKLKEFWRKFGGKWGSLRKSINKGAKASISADEFGAVGIAAVAAVAAPIMIALTALIKSFKAEGSDAEMGEFEDVIDLGKAELRDNPEYDNQTTAYMNEEDVAVMQRDDAYADYDYDDDDIPRRSQGFSFFSISGLLFKSILMLGFIPTTSIWAYVLAPVMLYCVVAFFLLPLQMTGKKWVYPLYQPLNWIMYEGSKLFRKHG